MKIIVYKFGGTSVADASCIRRAAQQIAGAVRAGYHIVAVASAQGKTTDLLLQKAEELADCPDSRELDLLLAAGEQVSIALLAIALQELGLSAVSLTGPQAGIHTDSAHGCAEIVALHRRRIFRELTSGRVVIVAGFQGCDRDGEITTLGRGGSDTTAVALAAALDACGCRICTDVDGVYDKDPDGAECCQLYDYLPYDTMLAMTRTGAEVLHPRSVELAARYQVPLAVTRAGRDDGGTVIGLAEREHHSSAADTVFIFR